jgi:(p)ppGpp synthase/HD superfamily hydrolase
MAFTTGDITQTNLRLYAQLQQAGWADADIEAVDRGYRLAADLLSGQYRAAGPPAVDHFVGVASVVAGTGGRPALVQAAILHNIYRIGRWRDGFPRVTRARRAEVTRAIGVDAEAIVHSYDRVAWSDRWAAGVLARADALAGNERDVVLLTLADEVENRSDLGVVLSGMAGRGVEALVAIAEAMGEQRFAELLREVSEQEASATVVPGLVQPHAGDVTMNPRTHLAGPSALVGRAHRWGRRRLADAVRPYRPSRRA